MVIVSDTCYLILIGTDVYTNVITEVLTDSIIPSQSELNTGVLYITSVDSSRIGTVDSQQVTADQPVLSGLLIPVEGYTQTAVQETSIETEGNKGCRVLMQDKFGSSNEENVATSDEHPRTGPHSPR